MTEELPTHNQSSGDLNYARGAGAFNYAIVYAFNASQAHLEMRQRQLQRYRADYPDTNRRVVTESLNILGLQWLRQSELVYRLLDTDPKGLRYFHHRVGKVAQENSIYVNFMVQWDTASQQAAKLGAIFGSAMEHGVIDQERSLANPADQNADSKAVSTAGVIERTLKRPREFKK